MSAATELARFCSDLEWSAVPEAVRRRAAELTLDYVGVTVRGAAEASSRAVRRYVGTHAGAGATVVGAPWSAPAPWAALANGAAAHALELDDVARESVLHPGAPVISAALACAEERDATGAELLTAIVCGYEVMMRVGTSLNPGNAYRRGFHPTGVAGAFGAAAAAARLLRLDRAQYAAAFGIAGSMASGSLAYLSDGSWTKRLNVGWAAAAGCIAAGIAATGFSAPALVFEHELGVLHAYSDGALPELLTRDLGGELQIMRVAIKPYGCCRWTHAVVDCMLDLRRRPIEPDRIKAIRLGVLTIGKLLVAEPIEQKRAPRTVVDAQFSAPFAAAVAFVRGGAGLEQFSDANIADPTIRRLMARTDCVTDAALDASYPAEMPGTVEIELDDGQVLRSRIAYPLGEPENPLAEDGLRARFLDLAAAELGTREAEELAARLLGLEREPHVRGVASALRRAS